MTNQHNVTNRRAHERIDMEINAEIYFPGKEEPLPVCTRDISMGGLFVFLKPEQMPEPGVIVRVRLKANTKFESPALNMEVMYKKADGIGLKYLD